MATVYRLAWMADTLRAAGLKVLEEPAWKSRGHGDMADIRGVLCHHTAGARRGNAPSLPVVRDGRPGLGGPLSQILLARDGTWITVAAGRCWHAGPGAWRGIANGNSHFIGIEAENMGTAEDPWPQAQYDSYVRGVAALLKRCKLPAEAAIGHKEWAPKRKIDPSFDMKAFRARVLGAMA